MRAATLGLLMVVATASTPVFACDSFKNLDRVEAQSLMDALSNQQSTTVDRMFAFRELSCADIPALRDFAFERALTTQDRILRSQVFAELMYQQQILTVDLQTSNNLGASETAFINQFAGSFRIHFGRSDKTKGCIGARVTGPISSACDPSFQVRIRGTSLLLDSLGSNITGELALQPDNTLVGFVRGQADHKPIPARAKLIW